MRLRLCLAVLLLAAAHCWAEPSLARRCERIRRALPVLKKLSVEVYRNQDWCRCFLYRGGAFMRSSHESTCGLFQQKARPFTPQAQIDFSKVRQALAGTEVLWVARRQGALEFALDGLARRTLIFQPHYRLPPDQGVEFQYTRVDHDFYLELEDWN